MPDDSSILTLAPPYRGYCLICLKPKLVAGLSVAGYDHQAAVCADCLQRFANRVETAVRLRSDEPAPPDKVRS